MGIPDLVGWLAVGFTPWYGPLPRYSHCTRVPTDPPAAEVGEASVSLTTSLFGPTHARLSHNSGPSQIHVRLFYVCSMCVLCAPRLEACRAGERACMLTAHHTRLPRREVGLTGSQTARRAGLEGKRSRR